MTPRTVFSLGDSILLLILTALLSGLLIPLVFRVVDGRRMALEKKRDDRRARDQKSFEAQLARQSKVIELQAAFLDDLTRGLVEAQHLMIEVTYYHNRDSHLFDQAQDKYAKSVGDSFGSVRAVIGRALWLAPRSSYDELVRFHFERLVPADQQLAQLLLDKSGGKPRLSDWHSFNEYLVFALSTEISHLIRGVASAIGLAAYAEDDARTSESGKGPGP